VPELDNKHDTTERTAAAGSRLSSKPQPVISHKLHDVKWSLRAQSENFTNISYGHNA